MIIAVVQFQLYELRLHYAARVYSKEHLPLLMAILQMQLRAIHISFKTDVRVQVAQIKVLLLMMYGILLLQQVFSV